MPEPPDRYRPTVWICLWLEQSLGWTYICHALGCLKDCEHLLCCMSSLCNADNRSWLGSGWLGRIWEDYLL
ncbi:MAG: hypothetical protein WCQ65_10580, partial [Fermentimonas sp.]